MEQNTSYPAVISTHRNRQVYYLIAIRHEFLICDDVDITIPNYLRMFFHHPPKIVHDQYLIFAHFVCIQEIYKFDLWLLKNPLTLGEAHNLTDRNQLSFQRSDQ
jgi:hypothetical protein